MHDPCIVTLAVNPKKHSELFKSKRTNKKHKGIKKGAPGMNYENYAERIKPLYDFESFSKPETERKNVVRFKRLSFRESTTRDFIFLTL